MRMQIADDVRPRLARGVRLQIDCKTGKGVLLYPEGLVELNETAQDILTRCDGKSLGEIIAELVEEYDANSGTIATNVRETLLDLQTRKLIDLR